MSLHRRLIAVELSAQNPQDKAVFYEWVVGSGMWRRLVTAGDVLLREQDSSAYEPGWMPHFRVDSSESLAERAQGGGGRVVSGRSKAGGRGLYLVDPEGSRTGIRVVEGGSDRDIPINCDFSASTREMSTVFLSECLALQSDVVPDDPYGMTLLRDGEVIECGVFQLTGMLHESHWIVYFECDDVLEVLLRASAAGARVLIPASQSPFNTYAVLRDPWGHIFGLSSPFSAPAGE